MKRKTKRRWVLLWLCYGAVMLAWLLMCTGRLALDSFRLSNGRMARQQLIPEDFAPTTSGIHFSGDWEHNRWFTTTDGDPQLHLQVENYVGLFVFRARAVNKPGGEMALYYTVNEGEPFSEAKKQTAMQRADGAWVFDLNGQRVHTLRLDPDSVGGVYWQVYDIVLNETKPVLMYYTPDALEMLVLLFSPILLYAVVIQLVAFLQPTLSRRRLERRWQYVGETPPSTARAKGRGKVDAKADKDRPQPPKPTLPKKPPEAKAEPKPEPKPEPDKKAEEPKLEGGAPVDKTAPETASTGKTPVGETSVKKTPVDEPPVTETPVKEAPAEETSDGQDAVPQKDD